MLRRITIQNLALIDSVDVEFEPGLNVITGPTGSGKSILITALKLTLGQRADYDLISDDQTARLTSEFEQSLSASDISTYGDDDCWIFRRLLKPSHDSPAFLNDQRIRLRTLRTERPQCIDFHGQHEDQAVFDPEYPRQVLDRFGEYDDILADYRSLYEQYIEINDEIEQLQGDEAQHQQRLELLQYQFEELEEFEPEPDEWDEIEDNRRQLEDMEEIRDELHESIAVIESDDGLSDGVRSLSNHLKNLSEHRETLEQWPEELEQIRSRLRELSFQLSRFQEDIQGNDVNYDQLMDRRGRWLELARKHSVPPEQLYECYDELCDELQTLKNRGKRLNELEQKLQEIEPDLNDAGTRLREQRQQVASELEAEVIDRLRELNLEEAGFLIELEERDQPGQHGLDSVRWKFSSHQSQAPGPLTTRISGGEISRVMLAIKSALAKADTTPVLVFDEIDTGISGEEADSVGEVLAELAQFHQVICITHLPLVAAFADHHVTIQRRDREDGVDVWAEMLTDDERLDELSRLISGDQSSEVTREQAAELLDSRTN